VWRRRLRRHDVHNDGDTGIILNGSLAGLVGITAGCAFVSPIGALFIGATAGIVVVLAIDAVEAAKIDDAVGAFAVHGACGALGTLAIGFWGVAGLTGGNAGLFLGGGFAQLVAQATGVIAVTIWTGATSIVMFMALKAIGVLRMPAAADAMGIDAYEHDASLYGDILPVPDVSPEPAGD
jgi:Amt family ammonium transporter